MLILGQIKGLTVMRLSLTPMRSYTLSSLNFANRTKKIEDIQEVQVTRKPSQRRSVFRLPDALGMQSEAGFPSDAAGDCS